MNTVDNPGLRWCLLVAAVVLLGLALAPAAPSATAAADPCDAVANQTTVVATPPTDSPTGPNGTVSVYRGSELTVHLCQPGDSVRTLDADGLSWATVLETDGDRLRIRIDGPTNDSLGSFARGEPVSGPAVTIVDRTVESALVNGSIAVESVEQRSALRQAEATYLERERALEARLSNLSAATDAVENGSTPEGDPVEEAMTARRAHRNASQDLRAALYGVADSSVGGPRSAAAIRSLGERTEELDDRTRERLADHDAALRDRQESATWSLRLRIVGLGLLGLAVGGVAGAVLPIRRGRAARRRLAQGDWTTYSRRTILLPVAIGIVLVAIGLGWLAIEAGAAIAEVMLP